MRNLLVILFLAAAPLFAIVDIAPVEVGNNPGLSGNIAASYAQKSGNTEKKLDCWNNAYPN